MPALRSSLLMLSLLAGAPARAGEGEFDPSFGNHLPGRSVIDFGTGDLPGALLVLPDRSLFIAGVSYPSGAGMLLRVSVAGWPDPGFGSAGGVTFLPPGASEFDLDDARLPAPDAVLLAGTARYGDDYDPTVCRVGMDGALDPGFGNAGCTRVALGTQYDEAVSLALDAQGLIVLGGQCGTAMCAVRLQADGALDTSFGAQGVAAITRFHALDPQVSSSYAAAVRTDATGIVLAGTVAFGGTDFAVARLDANGALDPAFSQDGVARIDFTPAMPRREFARDALLQPDGGLVIVGDSYGPDEFAIARLTADGELDPGFSGDGWLRLSFAASENAGAQAYSVLRQADGHLVVGGHSSDGIGDRGVAIVRLLADGTPESSFAQQSRFVGSFELRSPGTNRDQLYALALQDDRLVGVGNALSADGVRTHVAVLRLTGVRVFADGFEPLP